MRRVRPALPWIFLLFGAWIGLAVMGAMAPAACDELPGAFREGVSTSTSDTLLVVASHCQYTRHSDGVTVENDVVNWSGIVFALASSVGAWLVGAAIGGVVEWRRALAGIAIAGGAALTAIAVFLA